LAAVAEHADQVARAVDEAVVPFHPLDRDGARLPVSEYHQLRQVHGARGAAVDEQDALVADDLHPVVVPVVERLDHHVRRVGEVQHAVAARGLELEHDRGGRVQVPGGHDRAAVDPGVDPLNLAHQVAGQGEQVVAVVEDEGTAAAALLVEAPHPGLERHLPGRVLGAGVDVHADHLRLADLARLDHLPGAHVGRVEDEVLVHAQHDVCALRRPDHAIGLGHGERHWLLDRDVLARFARGDRHLRVQVMGDQEFHQVNLGIGQEPPVIGVHLVHAPGFGLLAGVLAPGVTHGDDAGVIPPAIA